MIRESDFETVREKKNMWLNSSITLTRAGAIIFIVAVIKVEEAKNTGDSA